MRLSNMIFWFGLAIFALYILLGLCLGFSFR